MSDQIKCSQSDKQSDDDIEHVVLLSQDTRNADRGYPQGETHAQEQRMWWEQKEDRTDSSVEAGEYVVRWVERIYSGQDRVGESLGCAQLGAIHRDGQQDEDDRTDEEGYENRRCGVAEIATATTQQDQWCRIPTDVGPHGDWNQRKPVVEARDEPRGWTIACGKPSRLQPHEAGCQDNLQACRHQ